MQLKWIFAAALGGLFLISPAASQQTAPGSLPGCQYNLIPPTLAPGQTAVWQCDKNANLLTNPFAQGGTAGDVPVVGSGGAGLTDSKLSLGAVRSLPSARSLVIYGDSFAANAGSSAAAYPCGQFCGSAISGNYFTWAQIYSGYRLTRATQTTASGAPITNCGVTGQTSAQILANIACPLAAKPDLVIMESGTNDANGSIACVTTTANNRSIYQQLNAAGIMVLKVSVVPRSGGSAYTTAQANLAQCYNEFDRRYMEEVGSSGFYFVDLDSVVIDPTQSSWSIKSGYLLDGVHPANIGGSPMGYAIAQVLNQVIPQWHQPIYTLGDTYDATNNPTGNLFPDGLMTGTSGAVNTCTGTAAGTSSSTNAVIGAAGGGATCVGAVTTLADGRTAQVITISGASTGTSHSIAERVTVTTLSNVNIGDVLEGQAWVGLGSPIANIAGVDMNCISTEGGTQFNFNAASANTTDVFPTTGFIDGQMHLLVTGRRTVTAVPSSLFCDVKIFLLDGSVSPSAVFTVASASIRKVLP